jgi:hypothetical protein
VEKAELDRVGKEHRVISTRLLAGRTLVHVREDASPGGNWQQVEPSLEDVYFDTMVAAA